MTTPLAGWGRSTWNNAAWNQGGTVDATGVSLTSSVNDVGLVLDINVTPSGVSVTTSTTIQIREGWNRGLNVSDANLSSFGWGNGAWGNGNNTVSVTGIGLTSSLGEETVTGTAAITLPSVALTSTVDDVTVTTFAFAFPSGNALTTSLGTETVATDQNISVTGIAMTSSIGTFSISGDSQVTVVAASEPELDIFVGTAVSSIGKTAFPSGNQLTGSLGTVLTSIELTGIGMTSSLGEETQETSYEAPSVQAVADRGNLTINISVDFTPTGVSATSTTGTLQGTFWNQVDDSNSSISWTEVHKAA